MSTHDSLQYVLIIIFSLAVFLGRFEGFFSPGLSDFRRTSSAQEILIFVIGYLGLGMMNLGFSDPFSKAPGPPVSAIIITLTISLLALLYMPKELQETT